MVGQGRYARDLHLARRDACEFARVDVAELLVRDAAGVVRDASRGHQALPAHALLAEALEGAADGRESACRHAFAQPREDPVGRPVERIREQRADELDPLRRQGVPSSRRFPVTRPTFSVCEASLSGGRGCVDESPRRGGDSMRARAAAPTLSRMDSDAESSRWRAAGSGAGRRAGRRSGS